ncbi:MAG TPA: thioredoxin-dependent thiol peroxidase [Bacteroidota bacterium]|nr:thioredoxin-dependent thiol peroxidase [Bacteroidota bacterium]
MASPKVGDRAPEFALPSGDGGTIALKALRGKTVILYFYPKDDTSGCTKEACAFRDSVKVFERKGAVVIGVSADSAASHRKFAEKYQLPFPLASDEQREVIKKYGVWKQKSMYGKKYMGIERTTFVIDPKGMITQVFPKVKVDGHVDAIIDLL